MSWQDEIREKQRAEGRADAPLVESAHRITDTGSDWPECQSLPAGLVDVAPFDLDLLPESLRPWIADIAERLQCPADYPAVAAMVALAGIIGRKLGIRPKRFDDWQVIPNLWGAVVGRPGLMKTPAIQEPLNVLKRLEIEAKSEHESAIGEYESSLIVSEVTQAVKKEELKKAIKAGRDADEIVSGLQGLEPSMPIRRRYLVNDSTVEKLGELLNENPNGLTLFRDELTGKDVKERGRSSWKRGMGTADSHTTGSDAARSISRPQSSASSEQFSRDHSASISANWQLAVRVTMD